MANTTTSTYMSLPVPIPGVDPGPQYAIDLNSCLTLIDQHDHSSGSGVQIKPAGININTDLTFNGNNATTLRSVRLSAQGSTLVGASDLGCLYEVGTDLYYNDGAGTAIRITQSGGIAGSPGSIANLTSPATAAYVSANSTFVWQSAANTPANLDAASIILRNLSANSKGLTLNPPSAMGSNYSITLPSLPGAQAFLTLDTSGNISGAVPLSLGITASMIANGTLTTTQLSASANIIGSQLSASANIQGSQLTTSINLPGNAVQENGRNVVVSNTNLSTSLSIVRAWFIGASATLRFGEGCTMSRSGVGQYTVNFTTAFSAPPVCTISAVTSGGLGASATIVTPFGSTSSVSLWILRPATTAELAAGSDAAIAIDTDFTLIAIGPR